jgi:hypothetical protein
VNSEYLENLGNPDAAPSDTSFYCGRLVIIHGNPFVRAKFGIFGLIVREIKKPPGGGLLVFTFF